MPHPLLDHLLQLPSGARFYRADLHNHTPADSAFHCDGYSIDTEDQKRAFARAYVRFARETQGLEIIGITDHNDVSWLPFIQEAAQEVGLVVFPGVELGAQSGKRQVHLLALFDPGTPCTQIDHFMSSLGLMPDDRFHGDGSPRVVQKESRDLTRCIAPAGNSLRGIAIAAHVSSKNGLLNELAGEARALAYRDKNLLAVEIPGSRDALNSSELGFVDGTHDISCGKAVACLNHSDGRGLDQTHPGRMAVGERATLLKLSHFSVEALRQAFLDYDSRVRLEGQYREQRFPRVLGLVVEGGFLAGERRNDVGDFPPFMLHFNPNLNTIIGGRGAGKSALLEAIRYAFDLPPRTEDTRRQADSIVQATLPTGARVTVFYELADGARYEVRRVKGFSPEVYDVSTGEKRDVTPLSLLPGATPLEVYGQKEIYEISNDVAFQLNLLDTYVSETLREIQAQEQDLLRWLRTNATDTLRLEEEIVQASQRLEELASVRLELERMERHQAVSRLETKKLVDREQTLVERAEIAVNKRLEAIEQFRLTQDPFGPLLALDVRDAELPHASILDRLHTILTNIDDAFESALALLQDDIRDLWQTGNSDRSAWRAAYDVVQSEYQELVVELGQGFSAQRYFTLRTKLQTLEGIENEIARRRERLQELAQDRRAKLLTLRRLRCIKEYGARKEKAAKLTRELRDTVRIALVREGNRDAYAKRLTELFAGRRIEKGVIEKLSKARRQGDFGYFTHPMHLAHAIRCERTQPGDDTSILASMYGISKAYRDRLAQIDDQTLFELEIYRIPDLPDICLQVGEQYRSLNPPPSRPGLSTGQKCTAILSIILVEREAPLIIDQPEDDLDNEFIFRQIVQTLRREKERRQFIVATHNANIPVTGDAELIIVMQADEQHGWIACSGSIDDPALREPVENILEGGREAFHLRHIKYELQE